MKQFIINIKNMVCPRCIMAVKTVLEKLNMHYIDVKLGSVELNNAITAEETLELQMALKEMGFELLSDKNIQLTEQIKNEIIKIVHHQDQPEKIGHLTENLPRIIGHNYSSLSKLFSLIEGITIEKYLILQKIEKAKELLFYNELNISEIAHQLNYSSSQHFSRQFKSVSGLTPSEFSKNKNIGRSPINEI